MKYRTGWRGASYFAMGSGIDTVAIGRKTEAVRLMAKAGIRS